MPDSSSLSILTLRLRFTPKDTSTCRSGLSIFFFVLVGWAFHWSYSLLSPFFFHLHPHFNISFISLSFPHSLDLSPSVNIWMLTNFIKIWLNCQVSEPQLWLATAEGGLTQRRGWKVEIGGRGGTKKERQRGRVWKRRLSVTIIGSFM